jgi:hypothetical protein
MKIARCVATRRLLCAALLCAPAFMPRAFGDQPPIDILSKAPLSLPRLAPDARKLGKTPIKAEAFESSPLAPGPHSRQNSRNGIVFLEIEPAGEWRQKLRFRHAPVTYVSFTLNGSIGTSIHLAGANLAIEQSDQDAAYAAIKATGLHERSAHETPWLLFGGARMAALNIVTVKIDRQRHKWSMWFRDALVADDIPLADGGDASPEIAVVAGKAGAWLCGIVCSDENPLFEDANNNTVPDDFEQRMLGRLLAPDAADQSHAVLREAWRDELQTRPPSHFLLTTPLPDSFPDNCSPDGQVVHNMAAGLKFGALKKE